MSNWGTLKVHPSFLGFSSSMLIVSPWSYFPFSPLSSPETCFLFTFYSLLHNLFVHIVYVATRYLTFLNLTNLFIFCRYVAYLISFIFCYHFCHWWGQHGVVEKLLFWFFVFPDFCIFCSLKWWKKYRMFWCLLPCGSSKKYQNDYIWIEQLFFFIK